MGWFFPAFSCYILKNCIFYTKNTGKTMRNSIFVYPRAAERKTESSKLVSSDMSYSDLRRPVNPELLKVRQSTIAWARTIPSDIRPRALVIKFPRIANILADACSDPIKFDKTLRELMMDTRGKRQGFPLDVLQDLANLRAHFDGTHKPSLKGDVWNTMGKRGNR